MFGEQSMRVLDTPGHTRGESSFSPVFSDFYNGQNLVVFAWLASNNLELLLGFSCVSPWCWSLLIYAGHVSFYFEKSKAVFTGDTLFSIGCGRLFEGSPEQVRTFSISNLLFTHGQTYQSFNCLVLLIISKQCGSLYSDWYTHDVEVKSKHIAILKLLFDWMR